MDNEFELALKSLSVEDAEIITEALSMYDDDFDFWEFLSRIR